MNLISAMGEHIRVCGNEYADGRVAELSEQICSPRKHTENAQAATARFMRIILFDVQKFCAFASITSASFTSSRDFTADRYRTLAAVAKRT